MERAFGRDDGKFFPATCMCDEKCSEVESQGTTARSFELCEVEEAIARSELGKPSGLDV